MFTNFFKWLWALVVKLWVFIKTRLEANDYYLVMNGNSEHILKRLSKGKENDFSDDAQVALLKRGNHDEIMALLHNKTTCLEVKKKIIDRGVASELTVFCQKNCVIDEDWADKIIGYGFEKPIMMMIEMQSHNPFLKVDEQAKIISLGNPKLTRALVEKIRLADSNIVKLIEAGYRNINSLMPRFCFYSDEVFMAVLENCSFDDIEYIAENFDLPEKCALLLLDRYADEVDIMDAFFCRLIESSKVQVEIVKKLSHEYVMQLLDNQLSKEACMEVVQKGNMDEIAKLIEIQDGLPQEVVDALLVRNVHSELTSLAEYQQLDYSVLMTWVKHCRFEYVQLYLEKHETDRKLTQLLVLEVLKRTVK